MADTYSVKLEPDGRTLTAEAGSNLMQFLAGNSIFLAGTCGGKGNCRKCEVLIRRAEGDEETSVLACQYRVSADIRVSVPAASRVSIATDDRAARAAAIVPSLVPLDPITERGISSNQDAKEGLGLAVDLGTTTVAVALLNMASGKPTGFSTTLNQQFQFGADVISRIGYSLEGDEKRKSLTLSLMESVRVASRALLSDAGASASDIHQVVFAGNTTMLAMLLGADCSPLITPPYEAPFTSAVFVSEQDAGKFDTLGFPQRTRFELMPAIGGYVGADLLSGLFVASLHEPKRPLVLLDIGTNSETAVLTKDRLVASSAAAGPAFEGGRSAAGCPRWQGQSNMSHAKPAAFHIR
ncbi:DUF4445 domain-containing protein [bacterium]|nr:DUF4445 domain-containing protein [bacterium]